MLCCQLSTRHRTCCPPERTVYTLAILWQPTCLLTVYFRVGKVELHFPKCLALRAERYFSATVYWILLVGSVRRRISETQEVASRQDGALEHIFLGNALLKETTQHNVPFLSESIFHLLQFVYPSVRFSLCIACGVNYTDDTRIAFGYELYGLEHIPDGGPALIVYYHGALPVDYYYFVSKVILRKGRTCHSVGDHFLFKIPGFKPLLDLFGVIHGPKEECVKALTSGHLLAVSPGGVREALFSDESYTLIWGKRTGFAQVAIDAKVPIIPMFTQNVREGFRSLGGLRLFRWIYERFKIPLVPIYGGFPVKFRTYLGDPIPYDPNITAVELAEKTKRAIHSLIDKHQKVPGNIFRALLERFDRRQKED